ncbi:MAG: hypothetical protein J7L63_05085 [Thermoplasmata archaeon]|nr:hypothetical protein [Thermoplasmata archaeon]
MNNGEMFIRKIDYPVLLLFHIDRILSAINENGITAIVETSVDALWATVTDELKKDKIEIWEEIANREITGKTEYEKMLQGKQRVLDKLQLIMNILGENGFLYRSSYEELIGDEVSIDED